MIKDTEDKEAATGSDTNYRDHNAMRVKQAGFGSAPARDYLEKMVEDEDTEDDVIGHVNVVIIIVPILVPLAGLLLLAVLDQQNYVSKYKIVAIYANQLRYIQGVH